MVRTLDRSYQGLDFYLRGHRAGERPDLTAISADFLSDDRILFLPLALRERDAFRIRDLVRSPSLADRPVIAVEAETSLNDDLRPLVTLLWDAVRFSQRHGILVLSWPENPAARDTFESLGLGSCLFVAADELLRSLDKVARLRQSESQAAAGKVDGRWSGPSARSSVRIDLGGAALDEGWILHEPHDTPAPHSVAARSLSEDHSRAVMVAQIFEQEFHALELRHQIIEGRKRIERLSGELEQARAVVHDQKTVVEDRRGSIGREIVRIGGVFLPPGTRRRRVCRLGIRFARTMVREGPRPAFSKASAKVRGKLRALKVARHLRLMSQMTEGRLTDAGVSHFSASPRTVSVDVVICIHNALEDVRRCLDSVVQNSAFGCSVILVDDGSDTQTAKYVASFAHKHACHLIRNETAQGYTAAANQGLRHSGGDFVILLNSDTIVSPEWIDRMVACAESDPRIGLVGPLSNTASWQSIPELMSADGDWASNSLDEETSPEDMARMVARSSARLYPRLPFLNGFCMMIRRAVLDQIGLFDEETFGRGYGEENDYCLRVGTANWQLAVADDVYVYHRQSRSYSHERRKALVDRAAAALLSKHGNAVVEAGVGFCRDNRLLEGIRQRARWLVERDGLVSRGQARWQGKSVLFVLPILDAGGGANVIIQEAEVMRSMGVDARLFNYWAHRPIFESSYPGLKVPVVYGENEHSLLDFASQFDAFIATVYFSVRFLAPLQNLDRPPVLGYYVQDYEPYFFRPGTSQYREARVSYTLVPDLVRVTKTEWNRHEVWRQAGVDCHVVGPSVNLDLFRPRPRSLPPRKGVTRIAAMIRPSTPRRQPEFTMKVLEQIYQDHRGSVEFRIFGCDSLDPDFLSCPRRFPWKNAGALSPAQLAQVLNDTDVFADFSSHQAMGLTAMEAMACGATVIVPRCGGAGSIVSHERNGLVTDSGSFADCVSGLRRMVADEPLRRRLQSQAMNDVCRFFPERAGFNILSALFPVQASR